MNLKHNALERVTTGATLYYQSQREVDMNRIELVEIINAAREAGATQQAISDACTVHDSSLSRQRIAQILNEEK